MKVAIALLALSVASIFASMGSTTTTRAVPATSTTVHGDRHVPADSTRQLHWVEVSGNVEVEVTVTFLSYFE
jgi:hypothetical protein